MNAILVGQTAAPDLHVMTFNVRRRMNALTWPPADRWPLRRSRVEALLRAERPTIVGAQEVLPDQASVMRTALGDSYRRVGHGRQRGPKGEACPVFYDASRVQLRGWEQVALSDHPEVPGSVSWGNIFPRVFVRAEFRDRATSHEFTVINTHLDVFSARARQKSAEELHRLIATHREPVVLLGDLNAAADSTVWRTLRADHQLVDAWQTAERHLSAEWATYAGYREPRLGKRIDALLVSPEIRVRNIAINHAQYGGGWPSDHLPVQALLTLPARKEPT